MNLPPEQRAGRLLLVARTVSQGFSGQADGQRDGPVNGSQQRLCQLLMLNEKGQRCQESGTGAQCHTESNVPDKNIHLHYGM